jgi:hypothetical protein
MGAYWQQTPICQDARIAVAGYECAELAPKAWAKDMPRWNLSFWSDGRIV